MTARLNRTGQTLAIAFAVSLAVAGCSSTSTSTPASTSSAGAATSAAAPATSPAGPAPSAAAPSSGGAAQSPSMSAPSSGGAAQSPSMSASMSAPMSPAASGSAAPAGAGCTATKLGYPTITSFKGVKVGFSQSEPDNASFRAAETKSMRDEATKQGADLLYANANKDPQKQIADIKDLITKGAKMLIVAPLNSDGLQPAWDQPRPPRFRSSPSTVWSPRRPARTT